MSSSSWMIELSDSWCRIAHRDEGVIVLSEPIAIDQGTVEQQAASIWEYLQSRGYQGEPAILAVDSMLCLSATVPIDKPQQLRERQTMVYRLEDLIPWAAEDIAADFRAVDGGAFAVAIALHPMQELILALENIGVHVLSVVPTAILASTEEARRRGRTARHLMVWQQHDWLDFVEMMGEVPVSWKWIPASIQVLEQELSRLLLDSPDECSVAAYELDDQLKAVVAATTGAESTDDNVECAAKPTRVEAAFEAAEQIHSGAVECPIELRPGNLGSEQRWRAVRRQLRMLQVAAAILVAATLAALWVRADRHTSLAMEFTAQQTQAFQRLYPNRQVPVGIRARLESELAQLEAVRGDTQELPAATTVLPVLSQLLASLPDDRRFRLAEIRIEEGQLYLDGEVREHSDAEAIAALLRAHGFEVTAPRSRRLEGGRVSFRITGRYLQSSPDRKEQRTT